MPFHLCAKWSWEFFWWGVAGSFIAVVVLPGCYTTLPSLKKEDGNLNIHWGALGRLLAGGIAGCLADRNGVNACFGGFFSWHVFTWASVEGWKYLQTRLKAFFTK